MLHGGEVISKTTVDSDLVQRVVAATRLTEADLGLVVCGVNSTYIERRDPSFVRETERYYARLEVVNDLTLVRDEVLKLAVFVFGPAEPLVRTTFAPLAAGYQVVVSGANWIDIMNQSVNKGRAVRALQAALGVPKERTVVFADYLNDLEMLNTGRWSFAMTNPHPQIRERAAYLVPSNDEHGVITVLRHLLGV